MFLRWYQPGQLLSQYRYVRGRDLRNRFRHAENHAKGWYDRRQHQPNITGNLDENELPLYYNDFKENAGPLATTIGNKSKYVWHEGVNILNSLVFKANEYIPGLKEKLVIFTNDATRIGKNVFEWLDEVLDVLIKYLLLFFEASMSFLNEAYNTALLCMQDIIDGKTDLSDVYNASRKMIQNAVVQAGEYYQYAMSHISIQMKSQVFQKHTVKYYFISEKGARCREAGVVEAGARRRCRPAPLCHHLLLTLRGQDPGRHSAEGQGPRALRQVRPGGVGGPRVAAGPEGRAPARPHRRLLV